MVVAFRLDFRPRWSKARGLDATTTKPARALCDGGGCGASPAAAAEGTTTREAARSGGKVIKRTKKTGWSRKEVEDPATVKEGDQLGQADKGAKKGAGVASSGESLRPQPTSTCVG